MSYESVNSKIWEFLLQAISDIPVAAKTIIWVSGVLLYYNEVKKV